MHVLAFSTVPRIAPDVGAEEVFTRPQEIGQLIGDSLNDLAEAGLTVTGPSVTQVHPLARHISRSAAIYRFERDSGYTARRLAEFAPWAQAHNLVFRVGNGPFRNQDGENLAAPGTKSRCRCTPTRTGAE